MLSAPRYCRKCGSKLVPKGQFCANCGTAQHTTGQSATSLTPSSHEKQNSTGHLPIRHMLRNRYRLLETVGQGGMGAVYLAQDTQLGDRLVAVKEMSMSRLNPEELPVAVEQFKREAYLLASLHHQNLPVIYDHFSNEDRWYLAMSFIQGGTLQAYLDATPEHKLPLQEVLRIGIELCNVLDYLHNHQPQVIFRDLKPLNIMVTPQGQIFLIDFGIARHFKQDQTKDTNYFYSIGYTPPEQYGQSQTSPRSDIYSLGATLHQMLTGRNPAIQPFQFPSLQLLDPTIPISLAKLIAQMLEMNEQQRPESITVVKTELEKILSSTLNKETKPENVSKDDQTHVENTIKSKQRTRTNADLTWQGIWHGLIAIFTGKRLKTTLWVLFILLCLIWGFAEYYAPSLGDYGGGQPYYSAYADTPSGDGQFLTPLTLISGITAVLIGIVFLLNNGQRVVNIVGGLALVILSNLALISPFNPHLSDCISFADTNDVCNFPAITLTTIAFSIFLLLIGIFFLMQSGNTLIRAIFSVSLAIAGIILDGIYSNMDIGQRYEAFHVIWIIQAILGGILFFGTILFILVRVTQNSLKRQ